jgi:hypothetical protein
MVKVIDAFLRQCDARAPKLYILRLVSLSRERRVNQRVSAASKWLLLHVVTEFLTTAQLICYDTGGGVLE